MKFGIYYIPSKGDFYDLGSKAVGYDIRAEKILTPLEGFKNEWNKNAREYGFHLTMSDAVTIEDNDIDKIAEKLTSLLSCFSKKNIYKLTIIPKPISFWRTEGDQAAIRFQSDLLTATLHTALVCLLQKEGSGSLYLDQFNNGTLSNLEVDKVNKIKMFKSPYVLDEFSPHFTLINPYNENNHSKIEEDLNRIFSEFREINIDSLCLVVQKNKDDFFTIYKEFNLS